MVVYSFSGGTRKVILPPEIERVTVDFNQSDFLLLAGYQNISSEVSQAAITMVRSCRASLH